MRNDFDIRQVDKAGYVFLAAAPRSGTKFIAETFQGAGIDMQHEAFGADGITAFHIIPSLACRREGIIFHQVRDPLPCISSMHMIDHSWRLIYNSTGISPKQGGMLCAVMKLWLCYNTHIEKYEHFRYKVEDIDDVWPQLLDIMGKEQCPLPDIPRNTHSKAGRFEKMSWEKLEFRDPELTKYIKEAAHRYGYEVS